MNFIKSPAFWILLVCTWTAPHLSEQVAQGVTIASLSLALLTALLVGSKS